MNQIGVKARSLNRLLFGLIVQYATHIPQPEIENELFQLVKRLGVFLKGSQDQLTWDGLDALEADILALRSQLNSCAVKAAKFELSSRLNVAITSCLMTRQKDKPEREASHEEFVTSHKQFLEVIENTDYSEAERKELLKQNLSTMLSASRSHKAAPILYEVAYHFISLEPSTKHQ